MDRVLARFTDPEGGFFDTADDHERLVTRPKDVQDNATPSGNAMAARVLLRLAAWTGEGAYRSAAERALRSVVPYVGRYPTGFAQWLGAMDLALAPAIEIAIVGDPDDPATLALLAEVREGFRPNQVVALANGGAAAASAIALLRDRTAVGGSPERLCLSRLCVPPAGHGSGWPPCPGRRARRWLTGRDRRPGRAPARRRPSSSCARVRPASRRS